MHFTHFISEIRQLESRLEISIKQFERLFPFRKHRPKQRVRQVSYVILNNQKYIPMGNQVFTLPQAGQPVVAYPPQDALVDGVSLKAIPGAAGTLVSRSTDNQAVAVIDSNGNLLPVAVGTFNLIEENSWAYTDEDTNLPVTGQLETSTTPCSVVSGPEQVLQQTTFGAPVPAGTPLTGSFPPAPVTPPVTPPTT
jgi:hypothetical protein